MLKKDELPAGPQDPSNTSNGLRHAGNRTQLEGADNCMDGTVLQGDAFAKKVQELDLQLAKEESHPPFTW
jgi:hypothetical protein